LPLLADIAGGKVSFEREKWTAMKAKPAKRRGEVVVKLNRNDPNLLASGSNKSTKKSEFRIRRILVPTDFSDCARKALQYALPFAREHGAALTLLYVLPSPVYVGGEFGAANYAVVESEVRENAQKDLAKLVAEEVRDAISAETRVRTGSPALEIIQAAKEIGVDLIIISTHGRTGLKHALIGSVAEHVVRRAPCPVLVVREQEHEFLAEVSSRIAE
jgi:nucleotide-binding universal stress UspA family protein